MQDGSDDGSAGAAFQLAHRLLDAGDMVDSAVRGTGRLQPAIAIRHPRSRSLDGWFVPVTVGELIAGFFVIGSDGRFRRWSTFQRRTGTLDGCPPATGWLSPERIRAAAGRAGLPGSAGEPFLSFDAVPDRLAWAVPFGAGLVFVAGDAAWPARG